MSSPSKIGFDIKGIGSLLRERFIVVPQFQRSYAWREEHVDDLLKDLGASVRREPEYFLGTLVFEAESDGKYSVIDGQQRLATVSILLAAIRDYLKVADPGQAASVETEFLLKKERRTQELKTKVRLNPKDHNYFEKSIISGTASTDAEPIPESHQRLRAARKKCAAYVEVLVKQTHTPTELLMDWVDYLDHALKAVVIDVPDDANAFMIFETLNDRGADLSIADLLKNFLFGRAGDRLAEVEQSWTSMFAILEAIGGEDLILTYIRHLWSSKYGPTREKDLYARIKSEKKTKQDVIDFAEDLHFHAPLYAAMVSPRAEFWGAPYGPSAREAMLSLERLRLEQFRPLLLAVMAEFPPEEVTRAIRYLLSCSVRFLIVGGLGGGQMERVYSDRATDVRGGTVRNTRQLAEAMKAHVPGDAEFERSFATARVSQAHLARYYLACLERGMMREASPELVPNANESEVNLEHVLPKSPSADWPKHVRDLAPVLATRIGNLTLMRTKLNSDAGNSSFEVKKLSYSASDFQLTRDLANELSWGEQEIAARQERLARLAVKTWPLS